MDGWSWCIILAWEFDIWEWDGSDGLVWKYYFNWINILNPKYLGMRTMESRRKKERKMDCAHLQQSIVCTNKTLNLPSGSLVTRRRLVRKEILLNPFIVKWERRSSTCFHDSVLFLWCYWSITSSHLNLIRMHARRRRMFKYEDNGKQTAWTASNDLPLLLESSSPQIESLKLKESPITRTPQSRVLSQKIIPPPPLRR